MSEKERVVPYKKEELTIFWKPDTCIHSEKCWRNLGEVFKPKEKPWIQPEGAETSRIISQVKECPSGALSYELKSDSKKKESSSVKIEVLQDGPLMVRGSLLVKRADGSTEEKTKAAFCRCGASGNKPYCDGSHKETGFSG